MKILLGILGIIIGLTFVVGLWVMGSYNGLVRQSESVTTSWSQVETQYQRRFDLIPGLVNATKGVLRQEQAVFGAIAEARTKYAGSAAGSNERVAAAGQMESALARLLVIVENYPVLKSSENVRALMDELAGTENRVAVSRERYNEVVRTYNVMVKTFPRSILASLFGFEEKPFFGSKEGAENAVPVNLELD